VKIRKKKKKKKSASPGDRTFASQRGAISEIPRYDNVRPFLPRRGVSQLQLHARARPFHAFCVSSGVDTQHATHATNGCDSPNRSEGARREDEGGRELKLREKRRIKEREGGIAVVDRDYSRIRDAGRNLIHRIRNASIACGIASARKIFGGRSSRNSAFNFQADFPAAEIALAIPALSIIITVCREYSLESLVCSWRTRARQPCELQTDEIRELIRVERKLDGLVFYQGESGALSATTLSYARW